MLAERVGDSQAELSLLLRAEVEDFLYTEAEMLEERRLNDWLKLFIDDATNYIPPLEDPTLDPVNSIYIQLDDMPRLRSRVKQLLGGQTVSENPPSRFCRLITNVRVRNGAEGSLQVRANFHVQRSRRGKIHAFIGEYRHRLVRLNGCLMFAERRAVLAQDIINQSHLSFIL